MRILGISCFFHDASACLVVDGNIVAAAQEERFRRRKHDASFPKHAINYCLEEGRCGEEDIDIVAFYEKSILALDRIVQTRFDTDQAKTLERLVKLSCSWGKHQLNLRRCLDRYMAGFKGKLVFSEHHLSHCASAFFASPFSEAAILTIDGVGEWTTSAIFKGSDNRIELLKDMMYPHSIGLFYSAFTYFTGFKVNSGEYKFMGLAPYGKPVYYDLLREHVIRVNEDGSIFLSLEYFDYLTGDRMTSYKMAELLGKDLRMPESRITQRDMDIAASVQKITEEVLLKISTNVRETTGYRNLCLAGGVALNCVANGKILKSGIFDNIWIQPASGDAGGALGAALATWHIFLNQPWKGTGKDRMQGSFLGVRYSQDEIRDFLDMYGFPYERIPEEDLQDGIADAVSDGKVVGIFHGRMEYGPRALGNRSILADPRFPEMQRKVNLQIKFRESFRPFAPIVLREHVNKWFEINHDSPYMLLVAPVQESRRTAIQDGGGEDLIERVNQARSEIPAVTHIDYSARVQTIHKDLHPLLYKTLSAFYQKTGVPVMINTSFNVRGEPIVCSPVDAYRCMMRTKIDCLFMEGLLVRRDQQPAWVESGDWKDEFELD